jgi:hypothetical protein
LKHLDCLDLDAADVQRIGEIIALQTGQSLAAEAVHWRRRRNRFWMAVSLGLLLLAAAGFALYQSWA